MDSSWLAFILTVALFGGALWLGISSNLLRDCSTAPKPPFSFSRLQLLWWVLIIAFCFLQQYGETFTLPAINATCLVLMGIGVGTKGIAVVIDARQKAAMESHGVATLSDAKSHDFFTDILSDEQGLSVHRLQAVIFNVIYGVAFYTTFVRTQSFPVYDTLEYLVLGISNVAYLGLKAIENDPKVLARKTGERTGGDELLDADDAESGPAAAG